MRVLFSRISPTFILAGFPIAVTLRTVMSILETPLTIKTSDAIPTITGWHKHVLDSSLFEMLVWNRR
jgi:hypothetical protein